jgi:hypothetical protein
MYKAVMEEELMVIIQKIELDHSGALTRRHLLLVGVWTAVSYTDTTHDE